MPHCDRDDARFYLYAYLPAIMPVRCACRSRAPPRAYCATLPTAQICDMSPRSCRANIRTTSPRSCRARTRTMSPRSYYAQIYAASPRSLRAPLYQPYRFNRRTLSAMCCQYAQYPPRLAIVTRRYTSRTVAIAARCPSHIVMAAHIALRLFMPRQNAMRTCSLG